MKKFIEVFGKLGGTLLPILEKLIDKSPDLLMKAAEIYLKSYIEKHGGTFDNS